jgi:ATP-binding cassette, subfamily C (CFTR/MRP), member 1
MRRVRGQTIFSGTVSYLPQAPWIMNATLRENVTFGHEYDENKFREVIAACQLEPDIAILPHREFTEIGEKGISLSGKSYVH